MMNMLCGTLCSFNRLIIIGITDDVIIRNQQMLWKLMTIL